MSKRTFILVGWPVLWVLLILLGSAQIHSADEEHKGFLQKIDAYVNELNASLDKVTPSHIHEDFYHRLEWCHFDWDFACSPIAEYQWDERPISRENPPLQWPKPLNSSRPRELTAGHIGPFPIPNLETIRGIPSAITYTVSRVVAAGWLTDLVFALALALALSMLVGAKKTKSVQGFVVCVMFFPVLVSVFAWIVVYVLKALMLLTSGVIFLLILALGIISTLMWIKDVWEARRAILEHIERRRKNAAPKVATS